MAEPGSLAPAKVEVHELATVLPAQQPSFQELQLMVEAMARSEMFKELKEYNRAITVALIGREMGIAPATAIAGIHVIEGKPVMSSQLMAVQIKRSGRYNFRTIEQTDQRCTIEFFERVGSKFELAGVSEFTMTDAVQAGLAGKPNWKKHPKSMLFARALSLGLRTHCPDALGGQAAYVEGEIEDALPPSQPRTAPSGPTEKERQQAAWAWYITLPGSGPDGKARLDAIGKAEDPPIPSWKLVEQGKIAGADGVDALEHYLTTGELPSVTLARAAEEPVTAADEPTVADEGFNPFAGIPEHPASPAAAETTLLPEGSN